MTEQNSPDNDIPSAEKSLTRQQFIQKIAKGAAVTGGLIAAPAILDKFLIPKVYAASSSACTVGDVTDQSSGDIVVLGGGGGTKISCSATTDINADNTFFLTPCSGGGTDTNLLCAP